MKKALFCLLAALSVAAVLTSCGSKNVQYVRKELLGQIFLHGRRDQPLFLLLQKML